AEPGLTSNEIFGDLLEDEKPAAKKTNMSKSEDLDKMLADTLSGVRQAKKKDPAAPAAAAPQAAAPAAPPNTAPQAKPRTANADLDRMLQDTLSGLEKNARKTTGGGTTATPARPATVTPPPATVPTPQPAPPAARPAPAAPQPAAKSTAATERIPAYVPDRVPVAQPVLAPEPVCVERVEDEPTDGVK